MKNKLILTGLVMALMLSACGLFKKDCHCPHFGKNITTPKNTAPLAA